MGDLPNENGNTYRIWVCLKRGSTSVDGIGYSIFGQTHAGSDPDLPPKEWMQVWFQAKDGQCMSVHYCCSWSHWWRCKQLIKQHRLTKAPIADVTSPSWCWHCGWFAGYSEAFFILTVSGIWLWGFGLPEAECSWKDSHQVSLLPITSISIFWCYRVIRCEKTKRPMQLDLKMAAACSCNPQPRFWTFMVVELPKDGTIRDDWTICVQLQPEICWSPMVFERCVQDLGPYSQMSSLSMFLHGAFPATWLKATFPEEHEKYAGLRVS